MAQMCGGICTMQNLYLCFYNMAPFDVFGTFTLFTKPEVLKL